MGYTRMAVTKSHSGILPQVVNGKNALEAALNRSAIGQNADENLREDQSVKGLGNSRGYTPIKLLGRRYC